MFRKTVYALVLGMISISLLPSAGICWTSGYYGGGYHGGYGGYHGGYYNNDAWAWGLGGLVVGSALTAAVLYQPPPPVVYAYPPPQQVVYVNPPPQQVVNAQPPTQVYSYKPNIPPGMCRWERKVLDNYGRPLLDQKGHPVLEYMIGSCQSPQ